MKKTPAVLVLFFLSGSAGLLYQVVWTRLFVHVFGATVLAVSTVLAAFMAGLALGGLWAGRIASRVRSPLRLYGILEAALGVYAALVPTLLTLVEPLYAKLYPALSGSFGALSAVRFVGSSLVLLPPTFLMGATLPLLCEHVERLGGAARREVAWLYAVNTFGAVAGTVAASFVMLPGIGLVRTLASGVALSLTVAAAAVLLARRSPAAAPAASPDAAAASPLPERDALIPRPLLLLTTGTLGFSALAFEVLWTRTLTLSLGTTTYAFAVVLAVFLLGIAAGGLVAGRILANPRRAVDLFTVAPAAIGLLSLAILPVFDRLPELFIALTTRWAGGWVQGLFAETLVAGVPLLLPTLISGAAFPIAVGIDRTAASAGRSAGDIYGANTFGAILGSWGAGFVLIPFLGLRNGIALAAALPIAATCLLLFFARAGTPSRLRPAGAVLLASFAIVLFVALPDWNRRALTRGGFAIGAELRRLGKKKLAADRSQLVFLEEGTTATVTVRRWRDEITMQINGITEASNSGDMCTQVMSGGFPLLFHDDPKDVLVIGLGSGITAGAVARFPSVRTIDCVEISESVVHGARFFDKENRGVMRDPRFRMIEGDGRNHLRLSGKMYDCIVSEPSNVWNAGISALMTTEFYRLCRAHMRPGGILCTFVQGYSLSPDALRSVLAAARTSFPRVTLWSAAWGDLLVIAGDETFTLDVDRILQRAKDPSVGEMLLQTDSPDLVTMLSSDVLAGGAVDRYVGGFPPNTDDNLYLEFEAPKLLYRETMSELFEGLSRASGGAEEMLRNAPPDLVRALGEARRARALETRARLAFRNERGEEGLAAAAEAERLLPSAPAIRRLLAQALSSRGLARANRDDRTGAVDDFLQAADLDPRFGEPFANLSRLYRDAGQADAARAAIDQALSREPRQPDYLTLSAQLSNRVRQFEDARQTASRALAIDPDVRDGCLALGEALEGLGNVAAAESVYAAGAARDPSSAELTRHLRKARRQG
ncbi:MAG: fused MFS/spermidine synthase [bacterium]